MLVEPLELHPRFLSRLADGFAREWPSWAAMLSRAQLEEGLHSASAPALPRVLVAFRDDEPLGTVALKRWFGEEPMAETPWVRGLFVFPPARGHGVGRALLGAVQREARELDYEWLHAATTTAEGLFMHLGWQLFAHREHEGQTMGWFRQSLRED